MLRRAGVPSELKDSDMQGPTVVSTLLATNTLVPNYTTSVFYIVHLIIILAVCLLNHLLTM